MMFISSEKGRDSIEVEEMLCGFLKKKEEMVDLTGIDESKENHSFRPWHHYYQLLQHGWYCFHLVCLCVL